MKFRIPTLDQILKASLFAVLAFLLAVPSNAQNVLKGIVLTTDEVPIANVRIQEEGSSNVTFSGSDGQFVLHFYNKNSKLLVTHPDFQSLKLNMSDSLGQKIFLSLLADGNIYNLAHPAGFTDFIMKNPNKRLENMPYLGGEADVNRQLQMLPGVEHGAEGFSNLLVRGGNVDENLMLYNGTPVYNYNHLFGITSIFHTNGIYNVKLNKGSYTSQYGGRISSLIEVETAKTSEYSGVSGEFEASPVTAGLYLRSIKKGDHYFTVSFRRSYFDLLLPIEVRINDFNANLYDLQLNFGKTLKNGDELDFSFMSTKDNYLISLSSSIDTNNTRYKLTYNWGNVIASAKFTHHYNKRFESEHSLHYSGFKSNEGLEQEILNVVGFPSASLETTSGIREYIQQNNFNLEINNRSSLKFGLQTFIKTYRRLYTHFLTNDYPGYDDTDEYLGERAYKPTFEIVQFGEYKYHFSENLEMIGGLRNTVYINDSFVNTYPEPRLHFYKKLDHRSVMKLGLSRNTQFIKLINTGGTGDPTNYYVPATDKIRPQISNIVELAYERKVGKQYSLALNTYYKQMNNIQVVDNFYEIDDVENDWQNHVIQGNGTSYGLEVMFQKNGGMLTGWASYTLSRATRDFELLSLEPFLFDYDRTHMLKVYATVELGEFWDFGFNYLLGSGQLFSIPTGKFYDIDGNLQLEYTSPNNYRSPAYHRLDISVLKVNEDSYLEQTWKFYVNNLLGFRNPLSITAEFNDASLKNMQIMRSYLYPIPGIAYIVRF